MKFLFFITIIFLFAACNGSDTKKGEIIVPFDSLTHRYYSSINEKKYVIIKNESDYKKLWDEFYKDLDQLPIIPEVDFTKHSVIAVFMGVKNTGGFDIKIDKITSSGSKLTVSVIETSPGVNCMVTDAITKPSDFVKIDKTDKEAEFKVTSIITDCK
ncbi:MAG TPA: protease complex subunit PrcB family protein [Ignavibacteria bacterium]|nr:protease complex subunit PrcB family protein [Ignavibacteria bacterium]